MGGIVSRQDFIENEITYKNKLHSLEDAMNENNKELEQIKEEIFSSDTERFRLEKNYKSILCEKNLQLIQLNELIKEKDILIQELQKKINNQKFDLSKIEKYYYFQSKRWDIEFQDGVILRLPIKNSENSLKIFKALRENKKIGSSNIVDLRLSNRIVLSNDKK